MIDDKSIEKKICEEFYWFHRHPELSYEEINTTKRIRQDLQNEGIQILDLPLNTGVVAQIGSGDQPVVAVRCDIDALPIQEKTELVYKSETNGKMHACGHDFHIAVILGAAYKLKQNESDLKGTVRIIFQPAEEAPGGALDVLRTGVLDDVQAIFGLHSSPLFSVGSVGIREGAVTAAVDHFEINFKGKGTHAAHPQNGIDPIVAASAFVSSIQTVVSRNVDPFAADLISITHFQSGNTWNVIPETAYLEGTARTLRPEDRQLVRQRIYEMAENTAKAYGAKAEVIWHDGPPATNNDGEWAAFAKEQAQKIGLDVKDSPYSLGGEDFAFYQEKIKGVFVQIGTGESYSNHNPHFQVDPAAIFPAAEYMAGMAADSLGKIKK
ncbi:amidohydrolase [Pectinatus haikarae]|uniref:Amidohydrolase n=1 Tax=Pectinatus haikarae TaxID=349096 RepID=A0ABT9Y773_9FIRM|nr:amidohydrolase [Pectinatus haikarae]MDQ0203370.1 amidohydrolase [Pectinatus haikarae]